MSQATSFKRHHVYELTSPLTNPARPNNPIRYALVVTSNEFTRRREQPLVTVLFLRPEVNRDRATDLRVKIACRANGGTVHLPYDHHVLVDSLTPLPFARLAAHTGMEISEYEKNDVDRKLRGWLDL